MYKTKRKYRMKIKDTLIYPENGRILFFGDLHYNHGNVIKHDSRPFPNCKEMNEYILGVLDTIGENDIVFDLGDTFWQTPCQEIEEILKGIKTKEIYKVVGNHDKYGLYFGQAPLKKYYKIIADSLDIKIDYQGKEYFLNLDHYPKVSWNHKPRGAMMLHAHTHGHIDAYNESVYDLRVDIGFNGDLSKKNGSFLVDFKDILEYFYHKTGGLGFAEWTIQKCKEL